MRFHASCAALLAAALVAGAGCSSPPPPPPPPPSAIDLVAEPSVSGSYENYRWPELLKGSSAIVVPIAEEGSSIHDDEVGTFASAFAEVFFGPGSPFVQIDQDAMVKAAKRRAVLGSGTPSQGDLQRLADQEKADFVAFCRIRFSEKPRGGLQPPATAVMTVSASASVTGSPNKGGVKSPDATLASNEQPTNNKQRDDLRNKTLAYMGRLLARKTLVNLTTVKATNFDNRIECLFKFFSSDDKSIVKDAIAAAGIKTEDTQEGVAGQDEFLIKIKTKENISKFQESLEQALTEKSFQFSASRSGNRIEVSKNRN